VDGDAYLREVCRYIVLNPVRAGLVAHPGEWRWSSFRATAGETAVPGFLSVDWVRSLSGARTQTDAIRRFVSFVEAGIGAPENTVDWFSSKSVMSDGALADQLGEQCRAAVRCTEFPRAQRFGSRPPLASIFGNVASRIRQECPDGRRGSRPRVHNEGSRGFPRPSLHHRKPCPCPRRRTAGNERNVVIQDLTPG
jgi:putative transposase